MAKVHNTVTFVQAAIALHGEKYDYSQTVYEASMKPITIICRNCGPFVMSQAQSHYRKIKPCGCRRCEKMEGELRRKGDSVRCKGCGLVRPYRQGGYCVDCRSDGLTRFNLRKNKTLSKNRRTCKGCGVEFSDRCRSYCTDECRSKHVSKPIRMECGYCGKEIWKRCRPSEQIFKARFCNGKCQRAYRTRLSHEVIWSKVDWVKRSKKAKAKWRSRRSLGRKHDSFLQKFFLKCRSVCSEIRNACETTEWHTKCSSTVVGLRFREGKKRSKRKSLPCETFEVSVRVMRAKIRSKQKRLECFTKWKKKIAGCVKNQSIRAARKKRQPIGKAGLEMEVISVR